ncbi:hypothetical protein [Bradyrhizobium sp. CW1]|uniref:hypothetical protein n=1 Tax=Bradyrhizobium sp. CW1 TaxID=2782686 RepID=UPI001FFF35AE|nr:hypothetical protein [Bradyrhizobium sp. CW1]UPJ31018.1 hypothetical protein IVB54_19435 [Bradyrhizobium sp. CW1]
MSEREYKVTVWGKPHAVTVYQKSKSVWEAVGHYMEETIRVTDRSAGSAIKRWKSAATYKGNG